MTTPMDRFRMRLGGFAYGGDYNPEQWDPDVWEQDVALMRQAHVNLVTLGVFSWSHLEPEPGTFTFEWMDHVLDLLHDHGIAVDLATPTMAPPIWLSHEHPEVLPQMEDGNTFGFGNRLHFDPTSEHYRTAAARITTALAQRYSHHPALAMWHISNEYGPVAYNPRTSQAFQEWLRERYRTLEELNRAWYTAFWSQTYTAWEQIEVPQTPRTWMNPSRRLDYRRFLSDALLECFVMERDIVTTFRDDIPVLTNYMRFYRNADYWTWAEHQDAIALDIYPDPGDGNSHISAALQYDLMRSLRSQPWVLMEQAASSVSQWQVNNVKRPGRMRLGSLQALAHGADTVMFFQWRASRGGQERFHSAMLPHSGTESRTWQEIQSLGAELKRLAPVAGARSRAQIAQLYDWEVWWSLTDLHGLPRNDFDFVDLQTRHYRPLWDAGYEVDMVNQHRDLDAYRVLVVPHAQLMHTAFAQRLEAWVRAGGTAVVSFFSGVVDPNNQVHPDGYPGALRSLTGIHIDEYVPALPDQKFDVAFADGTTASADWWQDSITLEGATALAHFATSDLAGRPAVTDHRVGAGRVIYLGTRLSTAAYASVLTTAVTAAGVAPLATNTTPGMEVTRRFTDTAEFLFVLNHADTPGTATVGHTGVDLLTDTMVGPTVTVPGGGAMVIQVA